MTTDAADKQGQTNFSSEMREKMYQAEHGLRGRDPGPWRVVADYLAQLELRVIALEGRNSSDAPIKAL